MNNLAGITGKTGLARDIAIMLWFSPVVLFAACGSDAADGSCPAGQVLRYESAGCGTAAKPVCGSPNQDACFRAVCSCQGVTISRCDYAKEPFASFGACTVDSGTDAARDQAPSIPDVPVDVPDDQAIDLGMDISFDHPIDGSVLEGGIDGVIDLGRDVGIDLGIDAGIDGASYDGGPCPAGQALRYETAGCGSEAKPVCGRSQQDACFRAVCSCKGVTISRCDYADEPFASFGSCDANGPG